MTDIFGKIFLNKNVFFLRLISRIPSGKSYNRTGFALSPGAHGVGVAEPDWMSEWWHMMWKCVCLAGGRSVVNCQ